MRASVIPKVTDRIKVTFPYDPQLVAAVKQFPGRKYLPQDKAWTVPVTEDVFTWLARVGAHLEPGVETLRDGLLGVRAQAMVNQTPDSTPLAGYPFRAAPFANQVTGMNLLLANPTFGIFDEMGTGKSRMVVDTASALFLTGSIKAALVVCPNTVKGNWADEARGQIAQWTPDAVRYGVIRCDSDRYTQWGKDLDTLQRGDAYLVWIVINYEALRSGKIYSKIESVLKARSTLMVLDESQKIKSPQAEQTQAVQTLGQYAARRVILSGTPITNRPLDVYSQFAFLDKRILGYPTFTAFKARYARLGGYSVHGRPVEIIGYDHLDELETKVKGYSRRVLKKDCLDLPPKVYERREVALSEGEWSLYKQMRDELLIEVEGQEVAAPVVLTKLLRLTQLTSGFVTRPREDGQDPDVFYSPTSAKLDEALEVIDEAPGKVIVWCLFHAELDRLREALVGKKVMCVEVHGKVTGADRDEAVRRFQEDPSVKVFLGQVATGGVGITLTAADTVVYLTNSYSWEHRAQSEDRAHRAGQTRSVTYVDLLATGPQGGRTVDHAVLEAVLAKRDLAGVVLGDVRTVLGERE